MKKYLIYKIILEFFKSRGVTSSPPDSLSDPFIKSENTYWSIYDSNIPIENKLLGSWSQTAFKNNVVKCKLESRLDFINGVWKDLMMGLKELSHMLLWYEKEI